MSDSQESEFIYDLPEGYDSGDENNPEFISVLSSGNSSEEDDEEVDIRPTKGILAISMLNMDALQGQISNHGAQGQAVIDKHRLSSMLP